jgi:MFS family permease
MFLSSLRQRVSQFVNPESSSIVEANIRNLYIEIAFASVIGAIAANFNGAFAARLGASETLIALLSSIPALVAALTSIPFARFLERRRNRRAWLLGSLLLLRVMYGFVAVIPFIFTVNTATWVVVWLILINLPSIFFTNGWLALLGEVIPENRRAFVFSRRSIFWSVGMVVISAVVGWYLDQYDNVFPQNYQLAYFIGFIFALISTYYVARIRTPEQTQRSPKEAVSILDTDDQPLRITPPIRRMLVNTLVYQAGLFMPGPLFIVYYINTLQATDGWIGFNSAAGSAGAVMGYLIWERLLRRHTFGWAMRRATLLTWLFPVGVAIFPNLGLIVLVNWIVNLVHPGVDLSSTNIILRLTDPRHRTVILGWYNTVINISAFAMPLVGVALANVIGIPGVMLIAGVLRLAGGVLFNINRVDDPENETTL